MAAIGPVATVSCIVPFEDRPHCGDGHVDEAVGEECDPEDPASFDEGCDDIDGTATPTACDPETCTLVQAPAQCRVCGDGVIDVDRGEECDGDNLGGAICPGGAPGRLRCTLACRLDASLCDSCGNGVVDAGEECDGGAGGGDVIGRSCTGAGGQEPLSSPISDKPYSSGEAHTCDENCRFRRLSCGYCNDGVLDGAIPIDDEGNSTIPEWCDGDSFDETRLIQEFGANFCLDNGARPNVGCADDCLGFEDRFDLARCCVRKSEPCPGAGDTIKCCFAFDHPDEPSCEDVDDGEPNLRRLCR